MAPARPFHPQPGNRLIDALPADERARLLLLLTPVTLPFNQIVQPARRPVGSAYFPTTAVVSALAVMADGKAIEVGTVGNEGVTPPGAFLGAAEAANQHVVQTGGQALRVTAEVLAREAARDGPLRRVLVRYQTFFLAQASQSAACNGLHPVARRCARWLLTMHDRAPADDLPFTHDFLAVMLGVRRASVTLVLRPLQGRGLIRYARGRVAVLDRAGLEAAACECYRTLRDEYDRLLG
jgi:CRP-like cAMP-binding protein